MENNTSVFKRGQIWRWEDPIYGDKKSKNEKDIIMGEATVRFSRYVMIIQNECTLDDLSIVVIPISTTRRYVSDLEIRIKHVVQNSVTDSYLQPRRIFPVHPRYLSRYICAVDELVIKNIDNILSTLYISGGSINNVNDILEYGNNVNNNNSYEDIREIVNKYISKYIKFVNDDEKESTPLVELKNKFDEFCEEENMHKFDIFTFTHNLCKLINKPDFANSNNVFDISIRGIKIRNNDNNIINSKNDADINKPVNTVNDHVEIKWTPSKKHEFIEYFDKHGCEEAAKHYGLTTGSAKVYRSRFEEYLKKHPIENNNVVVTYDDINKIGMEIGRLVAGYIRNDKNVYKSFYKENKINRNIGKDAFHNTLRLVTANTIISSILPKSSKSISLPHDSNTVVIINRMKKGEVFIPKEFADKFKTILKNSMIIKNTSANSITEQIFSIFGR